MSTQTTAMRSAIAFTPTNSTAVPAARRRRSEPEDGSPRQLGFRSAGRPPSVRTPNEIVDRVIARLNRGVRSEDHRTDECVTVYMIDDGFVISTREISKADSVVGTYRHGISPEEIEDDVQFMLAQH